MSRLPRRAFVAPFILTAVAALPGCKSKGGDTIVDHENPPAVAYRTWSVWATPEGCEASNNSDDDCPPDASCNPPPPWVIACPDGMTGDQVTITQETAVAPCVMETADGVVEIACPEPGEIPEEDPDDDEELVEPPALED